MTDAEKVQAIRNLLASFVSSYETCCGDIVVDVNDHMFLDNGFFPELFAILDDKGTTWHWI